jgi:hexosaminidase
MKTFAIGCCLVWFNVVAFALTPPAIIPAPQQMELHSGQFELSPDTRIFVDADSRPTGDLLAAQLRQSTGYKFKVVTKKVANRTFENGILLTTNLADANLGAEGYELTVNSNLVVIRAPAQAGVFYGAQTLLQLFPPQIFSTNVVTGTDWIAPGVEIQDWPRFSWRGMMLDVSRHFFDKPEVEHLLDEMALHKLNTFHWHLVDDQGWRIEIKKYPKLTQIGAWRAQSPISDPETNHIRPDWMQPVHFGPDGRYGGYYTQEDIREVVAYATARHITIIPEIEMPGHSTAALSVYPELSCAGKPFTTDVQAGVNRGVYCTGNDETYVFLQNVLTEVFQLFPSKYIHIGGDEVPTDNWKNCPKDQAVIQREGLKDASQLESYFIRRMEKFIIANNHTLIGWSEIREGGLAQSAVVMDWIGGAVEAASSGHDVVMTPTDDCYIDYYQSKDTAGEPRAIGGYLPLKQIYLFEPVPKDLPGQDNAHILGAQANLWTEYVEAFPHVEYMAFPRICALSEVAWSAKSARNWDDFTGRLKVHAQRLDEAGINYRHQSVENPDADPLP